VTSAKRIMLEPQTQGAASNTSPVWDHTHGNVTSVLRDQRYKTSNMTAHSIVHAHCSTTSGHIQYS